MKKISKKRRKNKKKTKKILPVIFLITLILISTLTILYNQDFIKTFIEKEEEIKIETYYLSSSTNEVEIYILEEEKLIEATPITRGTTATSKDKYLTFEEKKYKEIYIDNQTYYIDVENLTKDETNIIKETEIYTRTPSTILKDPKTSEILSFSKKGETLKVIGYDKLNEEGDVITYKVEKNNEIGYIYGKYTTLKKEEADKNYNQEAYDNIHSKVANLYNGGNPIKLDYYPCEKPTFENNIMPESVYSLYLNSGVLNNIDAYIEFAKTTKINSFVVDIKDNEAPAYPAETFKNLSPTNYERAINTYAQYKEAITKLKNAGFYVIGRITVFKDSYYIKDNPSAAISNKYDNSPYKHNGSYWPSAHNRDVWYFNVSLAKESVEQFGFNEINFDYVRFPDRMQRIENNIDLKNYYEEDKIEAIANFVRYATDELHNLNTYVSIDVFGETTTGSYTTAYGQYWPAISNIADVISGMPYPDHFSNGYYGINKPWNNPYQLLKTWGSFAMDRQKEIPTPAKVRTWIQAYDVMKYVDPNGIAYDAEAVEKEIRALYDSGLTGGYITWLSNSSLTKYNRQKQAFQIDYIKEYNNE